MVQGFKNSQINGRPGDTWYGGMTLLSVFWEGAHQGVRGKPKGV